MKSRVAPVFSTGRIAVLVTACVITAGCAEELGRTPKVVVDVQGRIHWGGIPIQSGWVEFIPLDDALGDVRSARIASDGTFRATRVALGRNVVRLLNPMAPAQIQPMLERYPFHQFLSPIRPTVEEGKMLDIDLRRVVFGSNSSNAATAHDVS